MFNFCKVRDVKSPCRANSTDAGIDFYVPEWSQEYINELREKNPGLYINKDGIHLATLERVLIPAGIKTLFPDYHALIAFDKSGIASKCGLTLLAKVIDSPYRGEIHINLVNVSKTEQVIKFGQKITQFILVPIDCSVPVEMSVDEYDTFKTTRGAGGFGSSGI